MKTILGVFVFLIISTYSFASGIEGTWTTTMQGPDGSMEMTFVFKMDGAKLTGSTIGPNGETPISNTKVNGNEFSFDVSFGDMAISHSCTLVDEETIKMKVTGTPMGDVEMILKRKK
jgi:hypothetical protein